MKQLLLLLSFSLCLSIGFAQKIEYSPKGYKALKKAYNNSKISAQLRAEFKKNNLFPSIKTNVLKTMSLSANGLATKMKQSNKCLVDSKILKPSEAKMINSFFSAFARKNYKSARKTLKAIKNGKNLSKSMKLIVKQLKEEETNQNQNNNSSNNSVEGGNSNVSPNQDFYDGIRDLYTGAGVISGAVTGGIVGSAAGPGGAVAGMGVGGTAGGAIMSGIGKIVTGILKKLFGVVAGPNGEGCTPPYFPF